MSTIVPILTGMKSAVPGNGLCVFFWDARYEFFAGGIGSSLGYSNYFGPVAFNSSTLDAAAALRPSTKQKEEINGVKGGFLGVGFDVTGNFSTTEDGKTGTIIYDKLANYVKTNQLTTKAPNTICVRMKEASSYAVHSVTPDLNNYPINRELSAANIYDEKYKDSPAVSLHQIVGSRDDVVFKTVKVSLVNSGKTLKVDIKNPDDGKFYPYHYVDLEYGLGEGGTYATEGNPTELRAGICFATSDRTMNCEIRNLTLQGKFINYDKRHETPPVAPSLSAVYI